MEANDNMTSNARRLRESRARLTLEQQQQYRERNAQIQRTVREGFSEEQLHQHRERNAEQHRIARDELSANQPNQIQKNNTAQHKAVWDALTQEQREYKLQQQRMRRRRNSRNAARTQDSLVNDNGEYLSHYMTSPPSAPQLANHESSVLLGLSCSFMKMLILA